MNSINTAAMANTSRTPPFLKLLDKLRNIVVVVPGEVAPRRGWDSASSREIQLELDLDARREPQGRRGAWAKEILNPRA